MHGEQALRDAAFGQDGVARDEVHPRLFGLHGLLTDAGRKPTTIEEAQEDESTRKIALALGMTFEELNNQEWSIDADVGNDDGV